MTYLSAVQVSLLQLHTAGDCQKYQHYVLNKCSQQMRAQAGSNTLETSHLGPAHPVMDGWFICCGWQWAVGSGALARLGRWAWDGWGCPVDKSGHSSRAQQSTAQHNTAHSAGSPAHRFLCPHGPPGAYRLDGLWVNPPVSLPVPSIRPVSPSPPSLLHSVSALAKLLEV